jgi:hypothetical protein
VSYWLISKAPILSPLFAGVHSLIGDIKQLPLGENWTGRYTLRIVPSNGAGLCNKDCIIFPPFSLRKAKIMEVEVRFLLICPGYQPRIKISFNKTIVADQSIGYDWQTIKFSIPQYNSFIPYTLRIWFDMVSHSEVPKYEKETIIRAVPNRKDLDVLEFENWIRHKNWIEISGMKIERTNNLIINEQEFSLEKWPLLIALTPWKSVLLGSQLRDISVAACRVVRVN